MGFDDIWELRVPQTYPEVYNAFVAISSCPSVRFFCDKQIQPCAPLMQEDALSNRPRLGANGLIPSLTLISAVEMDACR